MNFADNLKRIRKEQNLSQEQIAEKLGVSRQSVSKWENGEAYPEMDKMIQLCHMFNLNIDELLNQDIREVNNNKQAKSNVNKFVEDFLNYITKTIDMFSGMKFIQRVKCIIEQLFIILFIGIIVLGLGFVLAVIFVDLFSFIPYKYFNPIFSILEAIYIIFALILAVALILHIFKVRYLDYYVVVKENKIEDETDNKKDDKEEVEEPQKIILEKKIDKIIIRDPEHSSYRFISSLVKVLVVIGKTVAIMFASLFCLSLISLVITLVISLMFIKTGLLFIGILFGILATITINLIILNILYNFIVSKKNKVSKLVITFIVALITGAVGVGLGMIGITNFDIIDDTDSKYYKETIFDMEMNGKLYFENFSYEIEYVESDNDDIKIVIRHSEFYNVSLEKHNEYGYYFHYYLDDNKFMESIREQIRNINDKKIVDYSNVKVYIYTNAKNIDFLKDNKENYIEESEQQELIDYYESEIEDYELQYANTVSEYETKIKEYEEDIETLELIICELEGRCE